MIRYSLILGFVFLFVSSMLAQRERTMPPPAPPSDVASDTLIADNGTDTVALTALDTILFEEGFMMLNAHVYRQEIPDTLLKNSHYYNPAYKDGTYEYIGLGNLGDPMLGFKPHLPRHPGIRLGVHAYDYLIFNRENRFINNTFKPETSVSFVQAGSNADIMLEANYAYTFTSRINATVNYRRINHEGLYSFQKNRHTQLSMAAYYRISLEYHLEVYAIINDFKTQNNGGIVSDSLLFTSGAERRRNVPVNLQEGRTLMGYHQFGLRHAYQPAQFENIRWIFEHAYLRHRFFYYDNVPPLNGGIYGDLVLNPIGVRHKLQHDVIEHTASHLQHFAPSLHGALSLRHAVHLIRQEPDRTSMQSVEVIGSASWKPDSVFQLSGKAVAGLYSNRAAWSLEGNGYYKLGEQFRINADIKLTEYLPSLIQQGINVSFEPVYQNDFQNTRALQFSSGVEWKPPGISAGAGITQYNRYIYFDQQGLPKLADFVTIPQLRAGFHRRFGPLITGHIFSYQPGKHAEVPIPEWYSKHSLALQGMIFREAMLANVGFDLTLNADWQAPGYMPLTGNYTINGGGVETYPALDFHFSFKVSRFRAFLLFENILDFVIEPVHYQISGYPLRDFTFRLGIDWRFND